MNHNIDEQFNQIQRLLESQKDILKQENEKDQDFQQQICDIQQKEKLILNALQDFKTQQLKITLENQNNQIKVKELSNHINNQQNNHAQSIDDLEDMYKQQLKIQHKKYEEMIEQNLGYIDQLVKDKKSIQEEWHQQVDSNQKMMTNYEKQISQLKEKQIQEMKMFKENLIQKEKISRDKWSKQKQQEIKEITIKGLEPQIQALLDKHKAAINELKEQHQIQLKEQQLTLINQIQNHQKFNQQEDNILNISDYKYD